MGGFTTQTRTVSSNQQQNRVQLIQEAIQVIRNFSMYCEQIAEVMEDYYLPSTNIFTKDHLHVVLVCYLLFTDNTEIL